MIYRLGRSLLSIFLIGSGQIVKGEKRKGILLLLVAYVVIPTGIAFSISTSDLLTRFSIFFVGPLYLSLMIYSAVDAWT